MPRGLTKQRCEFCDRVYLGGFLPRIRRFCPGCREGFALRERLAGAGFHSWDEAEDRIVELIGVGSLAHNRRLTPQEADEALDLLMAPGQIIVTC